MDTALDAQTNTNWLWKYGRADCMARRVSWADGAPPFERRARAAQPPQFTRHPHNQLEPEGPGSAKPVHEVSEQAYTSQSIDLTPALVTRHTHSHIAAVLHGAPRVHAPRNVGVGHDEVTPENSLAKGERIETAERSIEGGRGGRNKIDPLASINVRRALRDEGASVHDETKKPSSSHSARLLGLRPPGKRSAAEH